jgi:galactokinase/mevalonate kinase-like predicted kinase
MDQPLVSRLAPGPVICAAMEPAQRFMNGGGLAGSTRRGLLELFQGKLPAMDPETLARLAFRYENGIDLQRANVSGAQDAIGICMPGLTRQEYAGFWWPKRIETMQDQKTLAWLERTLSLCLLQPRAPAYDPLENAQPTVETARALAAAADMVWSAIQRQDTALLAQGVTRCRQAQRKMFPAMFPPAVMETAAALEDNCAAWKFTGAGGGGWALLVNAAAVLGAAPIKIAARHADERMENL